MRNLQFIILILGGSLLSAQEQNNRFDINDQEEVVTSQRGPGTNTPGGDLEDAEPVPIDKNSGWLVIIAIAIIIYYTVKRKKSFGQ